MVLSDSWANTGAHGIPSHDTFGRVFGLLQPAAFDACFRAWVDSIRALLPSEVVAIDGKTQQSSRDRSAGLAALHLVSAWAASNRLVLGQVATDAKSNGSRAIPRLLELLHRSRPAQVAPQELENKLLL